MEDTLQSGDIVIVNKFSYGSRIPNSLIDIPWLNIIPYIFLNQSTIDGLENMKPNNKRLYSFSKIKHNDIIVFNEPGNYKNYMVKRCIALPKDTLEIRNSEIFINRKKYIDFESVKKMYTVSYLNENIPFYKIVSDLGLNYNEDWIQRKSRTKYISLTQYQKKSLASVIGSESIKGDSVEQFGPEIIPYRGFETKDFFKYERIFYKYEKDKIGLTILPFKNDYYFFLGDNRSSSFDSRSYGVIPDNYIVGKVTFILFSKSPEGKWRKDRFFKKI